MRSTGRTVKRFARIMTEADTEFVSLVPHGANQQPFAYVKNEEQEIAESLVIKNMNTNRPNKNGNYLMQRAEFDSSKYTEHQVSDYLDSVGFEGLYTLQVDGTKIIARSKEYDSIDADKVSVVKATKPGIELFIGPVLTTQDDIIEKSDIEQKEPEVAKENETSVNTQVLDINKQELFNKFDYWAMLYSAGTTMSDVIEEGMQDGLPIGADELNAAFWRVVQNSVIEGDYSKIRTAAGELADIVIGILDQLEKLMGKMEKTTMADLVNKTLVKKEDGEKDQSQTPKADDNLGSEPGKEQTTEQKPETTEEKPAAEAALETQEADTTSEVNKSTDLLGQISALLDSKLDDVKKSLKEDILKVSGRVESLEKSAAPRKGSEEADPAATTTKKTALPDKFECKDRDLAMSMGLRI